MVIKTETKTKCDVKDCKNNASFFVPSKARNGKFFLCKSCYENIVEQAMKARTPRSPKNAIKKAIDKKEVGNGTIS